MSLSAPSAVGRQSGSLSFETLQQLYRTGQYLDGYHQGVAARGPLATWQGPEERLLAARMSACLGGPGLAHTLFRLAYREYPEHPKVIYYHAFNLLRRRGPFRAKEFVDGQSFQPTTPELAADWELLQARMLAAFRDFQRADECLQRAEELAPNRPWMHCEKAGILFSQDRHVEAIASVQRSLELAPLYRPGIQVASYLLVQLNRDDEALDLLQRSVLQMQSGDLLCQLAALETELELHEEAFEHFSQAESFFPLMDDRRNQLRWLKGSQSDAAYHLGKIPLAAKKAEEVGNVFFETIAQRLRDPNSQGKRVVLPVGFVRQHHHTCAPATLATISQHWSMSVDHLDVVQRICYDGTPAHSERKWAEDHGFVTREFRVTFEAAKGLIDRGVPFTLTTTGPQMGHLQSVIGYDERRGTLLVRDPSERHLTEYLAEELMERFRSTGPRGMALVPRSKAELLVGLPLADCELYDLLYQLELALQAHDREQASSVYVDMEQLDAEHRLTIQARAALAHYDRDSQASLLCLQHLLAQYPDDVNLQLSHVALLQTLGRNAERRNVLEQLVEQDDCEPLFWLQLCQDLSEDARQEPRVEQLLRQAIDCRPVDATTLSMLGNLRWRQQQRRDAFELYRLAACSHEKHEGHSNTFFSASRYLHRADEALEFLEDRQRRFGGQSTWPAQTLAAAYEASGQATEAFKVLDEAAAAHPDDGDFMLVMADTYARYGKYVRSQQILAAAERKCHRNAWLRANAYLAVYVARQDAAVVLWRQLEKFEPFALDVHQNIANLLVELQGPEAAREHLAQVVARFPSNYELRVLQIEGIRDDPAACEEAVRQLLQSHPCDAWAHRELAIALIHRNRFEEAARILDDAEKLDPTAPVVHLLRSEVLQAAGKKTLAKEACRAALQLSIDYEPGINALIGMCDTKAERIQELNFIQREVHTQVIHGDSLFAFCQHATHCLDAKELLAMLQQLLATRSDLWQVWAAVTLHLLQMDRLEESDIVAREMVERFPLIPSCWLYLSRVQAARKRPQQQIKALEQALEINPTWTTAARQLAQVHADQLNFHKAEQILRNAIAQSPRDAENWGSLAELLWQADRQEEALGALRRSVQIEPGFQWAWDTMRTWGTQSNQRDAALLAAQELAETRPQEARSWLVLAECHAANQDLGQCLVALEKVLELNPRNLDAYSMQGWALSALGRIPEAIAACRPPFFGDDVPLQLQGREAEILYRAGEAAIAKQRMYDVVESDPDYYWAWECLFHWHEAAEEFDTCIHVAEQMTRISPRQCESWGYLASAYRLSRRFEEAEASLTKALDLNPEYGFAAEDLISLQLERENVPMARQILQDHNQALSEHAQLIWGIRVSVAEKDYPNAISLLKQLCQHPNTDENLIHLGTIPLMDSDCGIEVRDTMLCLLDEPETHSMVARELVDVCYYMNDLPTLERNLKSRSPDSEIWITLMERVCHSGAGNPEHQPWAERQVKTYKDKVRRNNRTWSAAAYLPDGKMNSAAVCRWMKDWKVRQGLEPHMLLLLIEHHWRMNQSRLANDVVQTVDRLGGTNEVQVWHALEHFARGRWEEMAGALLMSNHRRLAPFYQMLGGLLSIVIEVRLGEATYQQGIDQIATMIEQIDKKDRFLLGVANQCRKQVAKLSGHWFSALFM